MLLSLLAIPVLFGAPPAVPVYPSPADVRTGVAYGPTGADYTGTLTVGGGTALPDDVVAKLQRLAVASDGSVTASNGGGGGATIDRTVRLIDRTAR